MTSKTADAPVSSSQFFEMLIDAYGIRKPVKDADGKEVTLRGPNNKPLPDYIVARFSGGSSDEQTWIRQHTNLLTDGPFDSIMRTVRLIKRIYNIIPMFVKFLMLMFAVLAFCFGVPILYRTLRKFFRSGLAIAKIMLLILFTILVSVGYALSMPD